MTHFGMRGALVAVLALNLSAAPLLAQDSTNRVAAATDWSVFVEETPEKSCWIVSQPKETVNTRDGKPAQATRGKILLYVSFFPQSKGEVSFAGGYPFAPGSKVVLDVGGTKFELFTQNETAWAGSPEDDAKIIAALKAGASAIVTGVSARPTNTKDTFSLLGFTAALEEATARCK
ncbi:invasion associated locus B family protein [Phaeovulum sp.]|uniref:invasion associated locus B family protein n=2 Tax=Phaeovulum sp. TaxID=2934796 RepID=UPI003522DF01